MIGYFDTSGFVPLLVAEPASPDCRRFWDDADAVASCRLLYVEAAALAQAHRMERLDETRHRKARGLLDELWPEVEVIELDDPLSRTAADTAHALGLCGYDASSPRGDRR